VVEQSERKEEERRREEEERSLENIRPEDVPGGGGIGSISFVSCATGEHEEQDQEKQHEEEDVVDREEEGDFCDFYYSTFFVPFVNLCSSIFSLDLYLFCLVLFFIITETQPRLTKETAIELGRSSSQLGSCF
jgi:hypothetical protein